MLRLAFAAVAMRLRAAASPAASSSPRPKVLILTGPTAIGKSSTAFALSTLLNGEIVSADSVQVYRALDIASNKPSASELAATPHHLVNIADAAGEPYTAGDFFRAARVAIADVHARGALPVVVGGTMMYVRWLMRGRPATPPASEAGKARAAALVSAADGDWQSALAVLAARDPARAAALSPNDWYRLTRALEVVETTGRPMTEMPLRGAAPGVDADLSALDFDFRCVFLYGPRVALSRRIDERCEEMILPRSGGDDTVVVERRGVMQEVTDLLKSGGLRVAPASPCCAIGYRQTIAYLVTRALVVLKKAEGLAGEDATKAFRAYADSFQAASRGYAKRQMAWFRKEPHFRWVAAGEGAVDAVRELVQLDEAAFEAFQQDTQDEQCRIREDIIAQGKLMKTYIPAREWLAPESDAERLAVEIAERCARELAAAVDGTELERMLCVVGR